jgi:hypothetical protein
LNIPANRVSYPDLHRFGNLYAFWPKVVFVHDAGDTGEWRLKGHAVKHFYQWVSTWAVMFNKPSDIGFDMPGYDLPPI